MTIANLIDHTALKPHTQKSEIKKLIEEAKAYQFASVCVNPTWVEFAAEELKGTEIDVCTVIGFPLGANTTETKAFETKDAIAKGATEVDITRTNAMSAPKTIRNSNERSVTVRLLGSATSSDSTRCAVCCQSAPKTGVRPRYCCGETVV